MIQLQLFESDCYFDLCYWTVADMAYDDDTGIFIVDSLCSAIIGRLLDVSSLPDLLPALVFKRVFAVRPRSFRRFSLGCCWPLVSAVSQSVLGSVTKAPGRTEVTGREVNESRHRLSSAVPPVYSIHTIMHFDTTGTQRSFEHSTTMSLLYESPLRSLLEAANQPDAAPAGSLL